MKKKLAKVTIMAVVFIMVLAIMSTAFAGQKTHTERNIYGGASQSVMLGEAPPYMFLSV